MARHFRRVQKVWAMAGGLETPPQRLPALPAGTGVSDGWVCGGGPWRRGRGGRWWLSARGAVVWTGGAAVAGADRRMVSRTSPPKVGVTNVGRCPGVGCERSAGGWVAIAAGGTRDGWRCAWDAATDSAEPKRSSSHRECGHDQRYIQNLTSGSTPSGAQLATGV